MTQGDVASVRAPARDVPPPMSISVDARQTLARLAASPAPSYPPPSDHQAWRRLAEAREARWEDWNARTLQTARCRVETVLIGDVTAHVAEPLRPDPLFRECTYLYVHGGAFVFGAGRFAMAFGAMTASLLGIRTVAIDYRMPPSSPYPVPLEDCVAVYRALIATIPPSRLVVGGGSSGANLVTATMLVARDNGLPLPAAAALLTPVLDLTSAGDTLRTNMEVDVVLKRPLPECFALYAGGHDPATPYLSPMNADFAPGFPATFIQSGTRDLFLSDAVRMHRILRRAGIEADLNVWEAMPHGGFGPDPDLRENAEVNDALRAFLAYKLATGRT